MTFMSGICYTSLSSSRLGSGSSACRGPRLAAFFYLSEVILAKKRVACFIDGFNVYHSIDDLKNLCSNFIDPNQHEIVVDSNGHIVAKRPPEYAPPAGP